MRHANRIIALLLIVAAALRIWIVANGGQGFTPDESRYAVSRTAIQLILEGKVREGLAVTLASGEHPGFKIVGLIPALVEAKTRWDDRTPAYFFALFSELSLLLIWLCARRLRMSPQAQVWSVFLGVASVPLLLYARHLYPYDLSLCLALLALYVGLAEEVRWYRALAIGLLCGAAFLVYLGYWVLAGAVMVLVVIRHREGFLAKAARACWIAAGFLATIAALWLLDRWTHAGFFEASRKFSASIYSPDFGNPAIMPWEYLLRVQPVFFALFLAALVAAVVAWVRNRADRGLDSTITFLLLATLGLCAGLIVGSAGMHRLVVTGRVSRMIVPFFCLLSGEFLYRWLAGSRFRLLAAPTIALVVIAAAALPFSVIVRQQFPIPFKKAAAQVLKTAPPAPPGSYYRVLNVDFYFYEVEELPEEPAETLLVADHPYQFEPYLFEGFLPAERELRRHSDQRMRLVRIVVPPAEQIKGDRYGSIRMRLRFGKSLQSSPLISLGPPGGGDLIFARFYVGSKMVLGIENQGYSVQQSDPFDFDPNAEHTVEAFVGSLMPPEGTPEWDAIPDWKRSQYRKMMRIIFDGRVVLEGYVGNHVVNPDEVFAGYNYVQGGNSVNAFTGKILEVTRGGYPDIGGDEGAAAVGAVRMRVRFPAAASGVPEPLAVLGDEGQANLVYTRMVAPDRAIIGVEAWGIGAYDSEPFAVDSTATRDILISLPSLFPADGDPRWDQVPPEKRAQIQSQFQVSVDGKVVLMHPATGSPPRGRKVYYGENPPGGSLVYPKFTGTILHVERLPMTAPPN